MAGADGVLVHPGAVVAPVEQRFEHPDRFPPWRGQIRIAPEDQPGVASAIAVFLLLLVIPVMWFNVRRLRREVRR